MFGIGFWIRFAICVAIAGALFAAYQGVEHWCNEACTNQKERADGIQASWDKAKVEQKAREAQAAAEADDFQRKADAKRELAFKTLLAQRTAERDDALARERVGAATLDELRNTVHAANGESPGKPAASVSPTTGTTDGKSLNDWFAGIASTYDECRKTVAGWILWDDKRVAK